MPAPTELGSTEPERARVTGPGADLARFYEEAYRAGDGERLGRWRALGAEGKADHVARLCERAGLRPERVVEVGCGDGALLTELGRRSFAPGLTGFEISEAAVAIARDRAIAGLQAIEPFDGARVPREAGAFDLGILSHVLEHVPAPAALLREVARVSGAVVVEVPLEANLSARRVGKRIDAEEIGHIQLLDRAAVHRIAREAGLRVAEEMADPLPLEVHVFFAETVAARARQTLKAGVRHGVFAIAPRAAERLFTLHYAALCLPAP